MIDEDDWEHDGDLCAGTSDLRIGMCNEYDGMKMT